MMGTFGILICKITDTWKKLNGIDDGKYAG